MRYTLLEMTQLILGAMDSDEVNSIGDTIESQQVSKLIRSVYYDLATDLALPEHETGFQLNASLDPLKPCVMHVPTNVVTLREVRYNVQEDTETYPDYVTIDYQPFGDFLVAQQALRNDTTGVSSQVVQHNGENFTFLYRTDRQPQRYTTIDDNTLLFDSFDESLDSTLQKSKTLCLGVVYPTFDLTDSFYPDLDPSQFSLLINKAKVRAFNELKQTQNIEAASEARRQKIIIQKRKRKTPDLMEVEKVARFGRK